MTICQAFTLSLGIFISLDLHKLGYGFSSKAIHLTLCSRGCVSFSSLLSPSVASLNIDGDLLEHFGLTESRPMQIHIESLYGNTVTSVKPF